MQMADLKVSDFGLASFLFATGRLPLMRVERIGPSKSLFVFDDLDGHGKELQRSYETGQAVISALKMSDAVRHLKSVLHRGDL
jgi:hypothetical protein